jgi:hypothetical protein
LSEVIPSDLGQGAGFPTSNRGAHSLTFGALIGMPSGLRLRRRALRQGPSAVWAAGARRPRVARRVRVPVVLVRPRSAAACGLRATALRCSALPKSRNKNPHPPRSARRLAWAWKRKTSALAQASEAAVHGPRTESHCASATSRTGPERELAQGPHGPDVLARLMRPQSCEGGRPQPTAYAYKRDGNPHRPASRDLRAPPARALRRTAMRLV